MRQTNDAPLELEQGTNYKPKNPLVAVSAISTIARYYTQGKANYSLLEKSFYFFIWPLIALYLAWESTRYFFEFGGKGTAFLPVGEFSESFGAWCAFLGNLSFNWFQLSDFPIEIRNRYHRYQIAKQLGIKPSIGKTIGKLIFPIIATIFSGIAIAVIAGDEHGTYNQGVTGAVNGLLHFLGSIAVQMFFIFLIENAFRCCCHDRSKPEPYLSTEALRSNIDYELNLAKNALTVQKLIMSDRLPSDLLLANYLTSSHKRSAPRYRPGRRQQIALKALYYSTLTLSHATAQYGDKTSVYGYWQDTIDGMRKKPFNINDNNLAGFAGTAIYLPFVGLSAKVTLDTINEMFSMALSTGRNIYSFSQHPKWGKKVYLKIGAGSAVTLATAAAYFFGYVSANSGLGRNAAHGWNNWWNVWPSVIGTSIFNTYGWLIMLLRAHDSFLEKFAYSKEEKEMIHLLKAVGSFLQSYPKTLEKYETLTATKAITGDLTGIELFIFTPSNQNQTPKTTTTVQNQESDNMSLLLLQ